MAYQDDFRNKVLQALKAKNLAVDISQEATQQAIVEEAQNVANQESRPMSPEEMKLVLQDVSKQLAAEQKQFTAQSADFTAFKDQQAGGGTLGGSFSGGGIAVSVMNKDIMIIPTAGTATSINTLSQIDFKIISNPNAYGVIDPNEVKSSLYNWGERITGNTYDTPVLGIGGAWNGVSYAPTAQWGIGGSQGSGVGGSIASDKGFGQIIFFKPATSSVYAAIFNDLGLDTSYSSRNITLTGYNQPVPGAFPTAGLAVTFGGIGNSGDLVIQGAILEAQTNTIKFLSPLTISNSTATDLLTLGLSSATSTVQNFVGGGSAQYTLSTTSSSFAAGDLFYASGTGHVTLTKLTLGSNNTYLASNGSAPFWTNTIAANTVSVNAATGSTILYPLLNNAAGSGSAVSTDVDFNVDPGANILRYATGSFYVGTAVSSPVYTGAGSLVTYTSPASVVVRPGTNATTAISLQKADGTGILVVDTTNNLVGINKTPATYALDVSGSANLTSSNAYFINGTSVLSNNTLGTGVVTSSLTTVGTIGSGAWAATAITAHYGGTGLQTPFAIGDLLYANSTTTWARLAAAAAGSFLVSNGTGAAPQYVAGAGLSVGLINITANTGNAENFITFVSGIGGVGQSISNQANQLTYNPSLQIFRVPILSGTAVTVTSLTGTIITATQPNITSAASLATVGTITSGRWNATAIGTTYGGTGADLSPSGSIGNSNRIIVTGSTGPYTATLIDNATSGNLLVSGGSAAAPTFTNTSNTSFTFGGASTLTINNATITTGTITGVPTNANDIVNKSYADSISGGLDVHASARLTTVSAIGGSYRQAGVAGTRDGLNDYILATSLNTLIGTESGWDTVGIALTNGQRVLVKDGVTGGYASGNGAYGAFPTTYGGFAASWVANGIYEVRSYGGSATSGWLLVRATDTDNQNGVQELTGGTFLFVEEGTNYADHAFVCSNDTTSLGAIGFGSTQISWTLFAGGNTLITGQGLVESGNNIALLFNLVQANAITAGSLSRGFTLGGTRAASLGSSSLNSFTVTGSSDAIISTNTFTATTDGFTLSGGPASPGARTLTVTGSNITLTGGGFTLTLGSSSTASFNSQTLALTASMGNLTFNAGNTTPVASTQNIVQSGVAQYILSTSNTSFASGDLYYGAGSAFTALTRLAVGTGNSVLVVSGGVPTWTSVTLSSANAVNGILGITNGGTAGNATPTSGAVAYGTGSAYAFTNAGNGGSVLISNGSNPLFSAVNLASTNAVTGTLPVQNGGTGAVSFTSNGILYGNSTSAIQVTGAGLAGSVLLATAGAPVWGSIVLSTSNSVSGVLPIANGGNNNATYASRGIVYTNLAGTANTSEGTFTFASGAGMTITGANTTINVGSGGGYFINGAAVVSSFAGLNGAVTISNSASVGGTSFLSTSGQNLVLNYPGTGITGTGSATQVPYYSASSTLTGDVGLVYSRTAATGIGLSLNINATTGTILRVNSAQSFTSGALLDVDNNGTQAFEVDWKGMATHTASSGNTALVMTGGRTLLAPATSSYASIGFNATGTDPSAPNVGDLWYNGTNLYFRKTGGTNFDLLVGSVSGSGTANKIAKWSSSSALTDSNISDAGTGMTITSTSSIATAGSGATSLLTLQTLVGDNSAIDRYFVRGVTSTGTRLFSIDTAGNLRATTKSFDIPHPTKDGMRLVYGVLEGPEHGVYHRGTVEGKGVIKVELPEYWHKLVGDQYTIQLTSWGNYNVSIDSKTENYFTIQLVGDFLSRKFKNIKVDYIVHGSRLDAPLETEQ